MAGTWRYVRSSGEESRTNGAEYIVICTNLMHKVAPIVRVYISVPLIHMVDSVAKEINAAR